MRDWIDGEDGAVQLVRDGERVPNAQLPNLDVFVECLMHDGELIAARRVMSFELGCGWMWETPRGWRVAGDPLIVAWRPSTDDFQGELRSLINWHTKENGSNTPDFILAGFLERCLDVFDTTVLRREEWYKSSDEALAAADEICDQVDKVLDRIKTVGVISSSLINLKTFVDRYREIRKRG